MTTPARVRQDERRTLHSVSEFALRLRPHDVRERFPQRATRSDVARVRRRRRRRSTRFAHDFSNRPGRSNVIAPAIGLASAHSLRNGVRAKTISKHARHRRSDRHMGGRFNSDARVRGTHPFPRGDRARRRHGIPTGLSR